VRVPVARAGVLMPALERLSTLVNRVLAFCAGVALAAMMFFAVADMVLRRFGITVAGSYEIIGWMSAGALALALGSVQQHRGHVAIDLLLTRLGQRPRAVIDLLMSLLSLLLFSALTWYVTAYGRLLQQTGSLSETLQVIVYPWVYVVAAGSAGLTLALLVDFVRAVRNCVTLRSAR
jgi:TRAP-type C4-dicarboxylate transport system permease small subunit